MLCKKRPYGRGFSRDHQSSSLAFDFDFNLTPGSCQELHQCVDAESIDLAANQVADTRLMDVQQLCGVALSQSRIVNEFLELPHQLSAQLEVLGLSCVKPEVLEHISTRFCHLNYDYFS